MLDENLPVFYVKPSTERPRYQSTYYFSQGGEEPKPAYSVRHLDPALQTSKNKYAVALYDSFCPDVLYAETLLVPKWTQPSLSQEAIRQNGGIPPPPEPILPTEFIVQLYNPDQQVLVRYKPKSWNSPASWVFEMPQQTFRRPSGSTLDRTQNDPVALDITPRLRFNWQKDGKFSKDLTCYLLGKTVDLNDSRKRSKEPDITISIFKGLKEITLYEPNLCRVEMEDYKGLEVVLLLGAIVIRDIYFGHMKTSFNITNPPAGTFAEPKTNVNTKVPETKHLPLDNRNKKTPSPEIPLKPASKQTTLPPREPRPPPTDARSQWEIDAEAKRLRQKAEAEARERRQKEKEAEKRTKKLLEAEEREKRKRQVRIDEETERLKKMYGKEDTQSRKQRTQPNPPPMPQRPSQRNDRSHSSSPPSRVNFFSRPGGGYPSTQLSTLPGPTPGLRPPQPQLKEKRSIFGFKLNDNKDYGSVLSKKRSSIF
ncbi:hypothetical protein LOZ66_006340 [Ophidiomyces ophidiicola]|nr:hypothetical protein LOZ66_006340 [Ophidiomyces ophidiicola]